MTYSIVARDPQTGELGVAVQSHWFSVGSVVPWAMPGVGAVATQAAVQASFGPRGLALLRGGLDAPSALSRLLSDDAAAHGRQVAIVDAAGGVAAHTGSGCMAHAGHVTSEGVSCQANVMASDRVWPEMISAFEATTDAPLAQRLLGALEAAERAGGDIRGRQSAAILVVPASGQEWETSVALRVEDHEEPLVELRRLLALHGAYELAARADELAVTGRHQEASALYRQASLHAPGNHELLFWAGLAAAQVGELDQGVAAVREAIGMQPGWEILLRALPPDLAPSAAAVAERLDGAGSGC